jgi:hypothetical protein
MTLVTGSPVGNVVTQDTISLEGAPNFYFQSTAANPLKNPDSEGYYWGLSGTSTNPVYQLGCYTDVTFTEGLTINAVRCDTVGDKDVVQKRDYVELNVTIQHLFPFSALRHMLNLSVPTVGTGYEKMGIGKINNNAKYMVYLPKVYDEDTGDYVLIHLHSAKFVDAWTINFKSGENWNASGIKIRGFADESKPANQMFGVFIRSDLSALP